MKRIHLILSTCALLVLSHSLASAQSSPAASSYPTKAITLLVAFSPGGPSDVMARQLAEPLGKKLGQSIVVENMAGASGFVAWRHLSKLPPDGYTLLLGENALAINTALQKGRAFDPLQSFDVVAQVATAPMVLIASNKSGFKTLDDIKKFASGGAKPLSFSSSGVGTVSHMNNEVLLARLGIKALHVPYKGGGEAITAVAGGHVQTMMTGLGAARSLVEGKKIGAVLQTGLQRSAVIPNVPTLKELGITTDIELGFWWGVFAPKGLPADVSTKLSSAIQSVLADPAVSKRMIELDFSPAYRPGSELRRQLESEIDGWGKMIEKIKLEKR